MDFQYHLNDYYGVILPNYFAKALKYQLAGEMKEAVELIWNTELVSLWDRG